MDKIYIVIEGGLIQDVFSTNKDISVKVLDLDEQDDEQKKDNNETLIDSLRERVGKDIHIVA